MTSEESQLRQQLADANAEIELMKERAGQAEALLLEARVYAAEWSGEPGATLAGVSVLETIKLLEKIDAIKREGE